MDFTKIGKEANKAYKTGGVTALSEYLNIIRVKSSEWQEDDIFLLLGRKYWEDLLLDQKIPLFVIDKALSARWFKNRSRDSRKEEFREELSRLYSEDISWQAKWDKLADIAWC